MFMGLSYHTIDAKGRLIIPAKFRDSLGEEFVVSMGLDGCLYILGNGEWQNFMVKLDSLNDFSHKTRQIKRHFRAGAEKGTLDKQGRVLIPDNLRKAVEIDKDVVVIGNGNILEIWSRDRWDKASEEINAEEIAEQMAMGMGM